MDAVKVILYLCTIILLGYFAAKNKTSKKIYNVIFAFFVLIIAFCLDSYDVLNYRLAYDNYIIRGKELGFDGIQLLFSQLGVPFDVFKIVYGFSICVLLYLGIKRYTEYSAYSAALFMVVPLLGFATQLRSSMAGAIMINAFPLLFENNRKKIFLFILITLLASAFHSIALFYLILLLPFVIDIEWKKYKKWIAILVGVVTLSLFAFSDELQRILDQIQNSMKPSVFQALLYRVSRYLGGGYRPNWKGMLFAICNHLVMFVSMELAIQKYKNTTRAPDCAYASEKVALIQKLSTTMLLVIPFYSISMQFGRLLNYFLPCYYGVTIQLVEDIRKNNNDPKWGRYVLVLLALCIVFVFSVSFIREDYVEFVRILNGIFKFGG